MNLIICFDNDINYIRYLVNHTKQKILIISDDEKKYIHENVKYKKQINLLSLDFWKSLNCEKVILTNSSYSFSNNIFKTDYSFLSSYNTNINVLPFMNGILNSIFSIRKVETMITCLKLVSFEQINKIRENNLLNKIEITENIYFTHALAILGYKLPLINNINNFVTFTAKKINTNIKKKTYIFYDPIDWDYNPGTVHQKPLGGTQSALIYLMEELVKLNNNVYLLNNTSQNCIVNGITCINTFIEGKFNVNFELLQKINPDYLYFVSSPALLVIIRKLLLQKKLLLNSKFYCWHHHNVNEKASEYFNNLTDIKFIDKIIFVSYWQRQQYLLKYKIPTNKTCVIHNAVSPYFQSYFDLNNYFNQKKLKMVYTSTPDRGLHLLLEIFPEIKKHVPELELHVFSSFKVYQIEEKNDKFKMLYEKCRNMEGVVYRGSVPQKQLSEELNDSLIFAYPLIRPETYCICAVEALAKGCYVICSELGGLKESVGKNGKLIKFENKNKYLSTFGTSVVQYCNMFKNKNNQLLVHMMNQLNYVKKLTWSNRAIKFNYLPKKDTFNNVINKFIKEKIFDKSDDMLIKKINNNNFDDNDMFLLAFSLFKQTNHKSLEIIDKCISINEYNYQYYYSKVVMHMNYNTCKYDIIIENLNKYSEILTQLQIKIPNDIYHIYGETYQNQHNFEKSLEYYSKSTLFKSKKNIFLLYWKKGEPDKARDYLMSIDKNNPYFNLFRTLINKPIHKSYDEINFYKNRTIKELKLILQNNNIKPIKNLNPKDIFMNIMLHYYDYNSKDLIELIGEVYKKLYPIDYDYNELLIKKDKIRLGFSSGFFYNHSAGKLIRGLIEKIDKNRFEIYIYSYTKTVKQDYIYEIFKHYSDKFYEYNNMSIEKVREQMLFDNLDILIFPEISDEPINLMLSLMRTAPIQITHAWGHPMTTGSKTIDYVMTMEGEIENCQDNYTEEVIKMKNLSTYFYKPTILDPAQVIDFLRDVKKKDVSVFYKEKIKTSDNQIIEKDRIHNYTKKDYNLPENKKLYMCLQYLFKFNPNFTKTILKIIDNDPNGYLVLLHDDHKFPFLKNQLLEQIQENCLEIYERVKDRIIFLKFMEHRKLIYLFKLADIVLDPFPWGGGITSFEALSMGACIVTKPVNYLKGRFTKIMYDKLNIQDCIVKTNEEYITLANKLANDNELRNSIKQKILNNNHKLFEQQSVIKEWEEILQKIYNKKFG